jgi:hypothetical protein
MSDCVQRTNPAEQSRLKQQSQGFAADSERLLDQLDVQPGASSLDGCGPHGILEMG